LGFSVVLDMRARNCTWAADVKPVLRVLHDHFSASAVHAAYIVKPEGHNFWQKQRTSIGSQKYKFETHLVGLDSLHKAVDPSQLTADLDGSLPYDHQLWIELRCVRIEAYVAHVELIAGLGGLLGAKFGLAGQARVPQGRVEQERFCG